MKAIRSLAFFLGLALAVPTLANPHAATTLTWVESNGTQFAPFATYLSALLYVDPVTGYAWTLRDVNTTSPTLTSSTEASGSDLGLVYTTTDCTGTAYLNASGQIPFLVRTSGDGLFYATGASASVTGHSRFVGYCITETISVALFEANGPLTPPDVAAGPWHLEAR